MIGYTSAVSKSGRKSMYRSPMKRNRRKVVRHTKPTIKKIKKVTNNKKDKPKGFKQSYKFKMYTIPSMKNVLEHDKRMSEKRRRPK